MINKENLILDATRPEQFIKYGTQSVAFYDGFKAKLIKDEEGNNKTIQEPVIYICIRSSNDVFSVVKRQVKDRFYKGQSVSETVLYQRAYAKYLELKNNKLTESSNILSANVALEKKIEELEAKIKKTKTKKSTAKKVDLKERESNNDVEKSGVAEPVLTLEE